MVVRTPRNHRQRGGHRHAGHAQFIYRIAYFGNCGIDVRHRGGRQRAKTIRMRRHNRPVLVVGIACRGRGRQHLDVDARAIHEPQPRWVAVSDLPRSTSISR
jgi:hypothetical protein